MSNYKFNPFQELFKELEQQQQLLTQILRKAEVGLQRIRKVQA